jgi:hypothetical protein
MKNIYYIYHLAETVNEGGMARNKAFYEKFSSLGTNLLNVYNANLIKRFFVLIKVIFIFSFIKNKIIFIHQGTLLYLFSIFFLRFKLIRRFAFFLLNYVSKYNKLILEVNDLPYEQSKDLELNVDFIFKILEDEFYTIKNCNYIFASNEMEKYVCLKYSIPSNYSKVIINGAPQVQDYSSVFKNEKWMESEKCKFVYAGSLNRGRQIDELLNIFNEDENNMLIVFGSEGEWLNDIDLPKNIIFLGNFEESKAHYLVSRCDFGIIPYAEDRFYYNLCFPTKVSFYLTAGLPILATPLKELEQVFKNDKMILFVPFNNWKNEIKKIDRNKSLRMKEFVNIDKKFYYWPSILNDIITFL